MAGVRDLVYNVFFKRSSVYVPLVLVGSYYINNSLDSGIQSLWDKHNQGVGATPRQSPGSLIA